MLVTSILLILAGFTTCSQLDLTLKDPTPEYLAPLEGLHRVDRFPNEYLVELQDGYTREQHFKTIGRDLSSSPAFRNFSFGYVAKLDDHTRDKLVRRDPGVLVVEANFPIHLKRPGDLVEVETSDLNTTHNKRDYGEDHGKGAPYGLQMITTGKNRLDIPVKDKGVYDYVQTAGKGVQIYIMDTGIRITHKLFEGRARNFGGLGSYDNSPYIDEPMTDLNGHGTQ